MSRRKEGESGFSESFIIGIIALVFLITGYQTALFIHNAAVTKIAADRDEPDTVYILPEIVPETHTDAERVSGTGRVTVRRNAGHDVRAEAVRRNMPYPEQESFRFDPNTVSVEELCRLGFSRKQAESIDNYRKKGGRFRRKSDFAKSYVVSESAYKRLEAYIDIPLVDLNLADSAALDALPGIGGWFVGKIMEHRKALGGFSYKGQLMDIYSFDQEKFDGLSDLVTISSDNITPYPLWELPADSLVLHPYIGNRETARAIVLFRENNPQESWTVDSLISSGILSGDNADRMKRCHIKTPAM